MALCLSASRSEREMSFVSWMVSASVKSRYRPRAAWAPVQHALLLPVNPPRLLRSSVGASRRSTPSFPAAASDAISRVLSVESSSTMISSHSWPRTKPGSDWRSREARQAGKERSSLRAGMITESSRSGCSDEFVSSSRFVSFTTSYYRKWSVLCVETGQVWWWQYWR